MILMSIKHHRYSTISMITSRVGEGGQLPPLPILESMPPDAPFLTPYLLNLLLPL